MRLDSGRHDRHEKMRKHNSAQKRNLEAIFDSLNRGKLRADHFLDTTMTYSAANVAAFAAAAKAYEAMGDLPEGVKIGAMIAVGAGMVPLNYHVVRKFNRYLKRKTDERRAAGKGSGFAGWVRTAALAAAIGIAGTSVCGSFMQATGREEQSVGLEGKAGPKGLEGVITKRRPEVYDRLGYEEKVKHDFSYARLADPHSDIGRIQRTLRWQPIYRTIESAYGLPEDTLAGMIMQESMGDPVMPNAGGDGGLGVVHFQCTTANEWGMRTYGSCNGTVDKNHGAAVKRLIQKQKGDVAKIEGYDDRAHLIKVLDAAARYVMYFGGKKGTDYGIQKFGPGKPGGSTAKDYLSDVKRHRRNIRDPKMLKSAADDFRKRTGRDFSQYIRDFHETANNWGLDIYIRSMKRH